MREYDAIISDAAERLAAFLREAGRAGRDGDVYVWAIHTTAESDGALFVGYDAPNEPIGRLEVVRPNGAQRWSGVAYSAMHSQLWHACRNVPILPIPRNA